MATVKDDTKLSASNSWAFAVLCQSKVKTTDRVMVFIYEGHNITNYIILNPPQQAGKR